MSRSTKGKGSRSHGGAGLQFDKLLKVVSNSKRPAVAKTAGALGRFGVASFTSIRSVNSVSGMQNDEAEVTPKKSKYSSFKKRARLEVPPVSAFSPPPSSNIGNDSFQFSQSSMLGTTPTMLKPRKFFKSRGPMEVEVDPSKPIPPSYLNPASFPPYSNNNITPLSIPTPFSNQWQNQEQNSYHAQQNKRSPNKSKTLRNNTKSNLSSPESNIYGNNSSSNINQPIKLRIFKDKTTSKLVAEAPTPSASSEVKTPKKRGRKSKAEKLLMQQQQMVQEPSPPKRAYNKKEPKPPPIPPPPKPSGRTTRNSTKRLERKSSDSMPSLSQENSIVDEIENDSGMFNSPPAMIPMTHRTSVDPMANLEEDEQYKQLSQMLSSMEQDNDPHHHQQHQLQQQQQQQQVSMNSTAINLSAGNYNHSEAYVNSSAYYNTPVSQSYIPAVPQPTPPPQYEPQHREQDIRSILEDDWDDQDEEAALSPKKINSSSPPKTTRFDMSALISSNQTEQHVPQSQPHEDYPYPMHQRDTQQPLVQQPAFYTSPYSMRNLLSAPAADATMETKPQCYNADPPMQTLPTMTVPNFAEVVPENQPSETDKVEDVEMAPVVAAPPKKATFFKHRRQATAAVAPGNKGTTTKKHLALYRHKFEGQEDEEAARLQAEAAQRQAVTTFDDDYYDVDTSLQSVRGFDGGNQEYSKATCNREAKQLFTVVKNVRQIHELQEAAEVHEFDGDIFYILEDLKSQNPITKRCLSAITLAIRCMEPAFRMHLRAHGTVTEFCKELQDAPQNPILALLASTVLFVLSQDRLNMDLDTESLQLILALAKADEQTQAMDENVETLKHRQRVLDLCTEMKNRGHAKHLKLEKISASELAMETLLFLAGSKRAGEWVKSELRALGGLDYIVGELGRSLSYVHVELSRFGFTNDVIDRLWKIDRCLRVVQQVTFNHEENQRYILGGGSGSDGQADASVFNILLRFCKDNLELMGYNNGEAECVLREILFSVLRTLVNLSHDYRGIVYGSERLISQEGFLELALYCVFQMPATTQDDKVFDLLMHSLCLLLNVVEHSRRNRASLLSFRMMRDPSGRLFFTNAPDDPNVEFELPALDAFVEMFLSRERAAKNDEARTDDILTKGADSPRHNSSQDKDKNSQDQEGASIQDTFDKLIQTAGKHMENCLIAAYLALLLAYLIMDDPVSATRVRNSLPGGKYLSLMVFLKKLFNFMSITSSASGSVRGLKATAFAMKFFAKADPQSNEELKRILPD